MTHRTTGMTALLKIAGNMRHLVNIALQNMTNAAAALVISKQKPVLILDGCITWAMQQASPARIRAVPPQLHASGNTEKDMHPLMALMGVSHPSVSTIGH